MEYYPKCSNTEESITRALESINVDSSLKNRKKIAALNGISNFSGKYEENVELLNKLKKGILIKSISGGSSNVNTNTTQTTSVKSSGDMIKKIEQSQKYAGKKKVLSIIGTLLFNHGYETAFVAGVLGNIYHEGEIGKFESSNYTKNPKAEPAYLKFMDDLYNYRSVYSNKNITNVSMKNLSTVMEKLKKDNWKKGAFGLGCVQWTFERTYTLFKLYENECGNSDKITLEQAIAAEGKMVIQELTGKYKNIYIDWKKNNPNLNCGKAAYNAGHMICIKYEIPQDYQNKADIRGNTSQDLYNIMTT